MEALQAAVSSLLEKAQNASASNLASAVEKATAALKLPSDLEKSRAEMRKLALEESKLKYENETVTRRERSERVKDYVSILAPIVAVVTLAATLFVQGWQFVRSEEDKKEAAEDAQWDAAVKLISQTGKLSPGVIALNPFLKSTRYRNLATDTAVKLLATSTDPTFFTDLFGAAFVPVGRNNLDQVVKLDRALTARGEPLWGKTWDAKTENNDIKKLDPQEKEIYDYIDYVLPKISAQVASVLKAPRPNGSSVDLSATTFKGDWGGVDLRGASIDNIRLVSVDLKGADLEKITVLDNAYFFHVAWWEAKKISPELLAYLETNSDSEYNPNAKYGPKDEAFTQQQYTAALDRLKHPKP